MTTTEYRATQIYLVQQRYHAYKLSPEQAEEIYNFELERDTPSEKNSLSQWEEWDFELITFKEILTAEQLALYLKDHAAAVKAHEDFLVAQDNGPERLKQLSYVNRVIDFNKNDFVPALLKNENVRSYMLLTSYKKSKTDYLKEEFKKYLSDAKKEILCRSFRHSRTFSPNELKLGLLWHSLKYIVPDYEDFYKTTDKPTQGVADYLYQWVNSGFHEMDEFLANSLKEAKQSSDNLFKEHIGELRGWHAVVSRPSPEDAVKSFRMSLLLMDAAK